MRPPRRRAKPDSSMPPEVLAEIKRRKQEYKAKLSAKMDELERSIKMKGAKQPYGPPTFDPDYLDACIARLDSLLEHIPQPERIEDGMLKMREALVRAKGGDTLTDMRILEKLAKDHEYRGQTTEHWVLRMLYPVKKTYRHKP